MDGNKKEAKGRNYKKKNSDIIFYTPKSNLAIESLQRTIAFNNLFKYVNKNIKKGEIKNDEIKRGERKNDDIKKDDVQNDDIQNDDIKKEDIKKEDIQNDDIKKEDIKNYHIKNYHIRNDDIKNHPINNDQKICDQKKLDHFKHNIIKYDQFKNVPVKKKKKENVKNMIGRKVHTHELNKKNIFVLPKNNMNNNFEEKKKIPLKKNKKVKKRTFSESTINILSYFKNDKLIKLKEKDNEKYIENYRKTGTPNNDINNTIFNIDINKNNINNNIIKNNIIKNNIIKNNIINNGTIINPLITNIDNLNKIYKKVNEKSYLDVNSCHKRVRSENYQCKIFLEEKMKLNNMDYKNDTCDKVNEHLNHFKTDIYYNQLNQNENYLYDKNLKNNKYPINNNDENFIEKEKYYEYLENIYLYSKKYFLSHKMEYISKYLFYKNNNLKNLIFLIDSLFLKKKYVEILELLRDYKHLWIYPIYMKNEFKIKYLDKKKKKKINNIRRKNINYKKLGNEPKYKNKIICKNQKNNFHYNDKIINNNDNNKNNVFIINNNNKKNKKKIEKKINNNNIIIINNNKKNKNKNKKIINNNNIYTTTTNNNNNYYYYHNFNVLYEKKHNLKLFHKNIQTEYFNGNNNFVIKNMKLYSPHNIPLKNTNDYLPKKKENGEIKINKNNRKHSCIYINNMCEKYYPFIYNKKKKSTKRMFYCISYIAFVKIICLLKLKNSNCLNKGIRFVNRIYKKTFFNKNTHYLVHAIIRLYELKGLFNSSLKYSMILFLNFPLYPHIILKLFSFSILCLKEEIYLILLASYPKNFSWFKYFLFFILYSVNFQFRDKKVFNNFLFLIENVIKKKKNKNFKSKYKGKNIIYDMKKDDIPIYNERIRLDMNKKKINTNNNNNNNKSNINNINNNENKSNNNIINNNKININNININSNIYNNNNNYFIDNIDYHDIHNPNINNNDTYIYNLQSNTFEKKKSYNNVSNDLYYSYEPILKRDNINANNIIYKKIILYKSSYNKITLYDTYNYLVNNRFSKYFPKFFIYSKLYIIINIKKSFYEKNFIMCLSLCKLLLNDYIYDPSVITFFVNSCYLLNNISSIKSLASELKKNNMYICFLFCNATLLLYFREIDKSIEIYKYIVDTYENVFSDLYFFCFLNLINTLHITQKASQIINHCICFNKLFFNNIQTYLLLSYYYYVNNIPLKSYSSIMKAYKMYHYNPDIFYMLSLLSLTAKRYKEYVTFSELSLFFSLRISIIRNYIFSKIYETQYEYLPFHLLYYKFKIINFENSMIKFPINMEPFMCYIFFENLIKSYITYHIYSYERQGLDYLLLAENLCKMGFLIFSKDLKFLQILKFIQDHKSNNKSICYLVENIN
ncbi:conserved Plasmodium protein, unknown function [Plasmodium sp. gorilla clade G2]|uniref:conserved Plasmodium protein, unknown function n=1 Tax=Plasmodium sp. gorilla clade G2 TaxID=880535 RepID=UPI000D20A65D|nr:conserved Plasmodium protein, unknown function [Plasmodium sp. gorilla clade G2]SOV13519.1 conserved Plasmodium protein, unknown function [Plasmodium sp. gorilla clade G2]